MSVSLSLAKILFAAFFFLWNWTIGQAACFPFLLSIGSTQNPEAPKNAAEAPQIEMLAMRLDLSTGPEPHSGEKWWAFCKTLDGDFVLHHATITVTTMFDICNKREVPCVAIEPGWNPWFLLKGSDRFSEGPVRTKPGFAKIRLLPGERCSYRRSDGRYDELFALGCVEGDGLFAENYSINIREGYVAEDRFQEILFGQKACIVEGFPEIKWIGDLDRDGRMDLLLNTNPFPDGRDILFLSSLAGKENLSAKPVKFSIQAVADGVFHYYGFLVGV